MRLFEIRDDAADIVKGPAFERHGLTDAAIERAAHGRFLVLTDEAPLAAHLERQGIAVLNYNHIRALDW